MNPFELDALKNHPKEGPVYMVNLVKYREKSLDGDGSGRDAYNRYATVARPLLGPMDAEHNDLRPAPCARRAAGRV